LVVDDAAALPLSQQTLSPRVVRNSGNNSGLFQPQVAGRPAKFPGIRAKPLLPAGLAGKNFSRADMVFE